MKQGKPAILVSALIGAATCAHAAEEWRALDLTAPSIRSDESIELSVKTGPLARGARLVIMTEKGEILGAVAPFAMRSAPATSTIPVPRDALVGGQVRLHLQVLEPGAQPRPPRPDELEGLEILARPAR